jgi:hypothetical protein
MLSYLRLLLATLLVVLSTTTAQATGKNVNEQLRDFALDRVKDGQRLITGPSEISLPTIDPDTSCVDLYHRRTTQSNSDIPRRDLDPSFIFPRLQRDHRTPRSN